MQPSPTALAILNAIPAWLQAVVVLLGAFVAFCAALHTFFEFISTFWAPAQKAADAMTKIGNGVQHAIVLLGKALDLLKGLANLGKTPPAAGAAVFLLALGCATLSSATGCANPSKTANDVVTVLNDVQKGCILLEELAPVLDPSANAQPAFADLKVACNIESVADSAIQQAIDDLQPVLGQARAYKDKTGHLPPSLPLGKKKVSTTRSVVPLRGRAPVVVFEDAA